MSLQVWLPLNGDLHNQGLSDVTVTNNGATVDTAGKIGSCYSFDGSDDFILTVCSNYPTILSGNFSIALWFYNDDSGSRSVLFGDYGLTGAFKFNIEKTAGEKLRVYWNAGRPDWNSSQTTLPVNTWSHIVVTKNEDTFYSYLNGTLVDSYTNVPSSTVPTTATTFYFGRDYRATSVALKGKLNDLRIYDHCLSPKEVKELSKGLIAHYPLNDGVGGENFVPNQSQYTIDSPYVIQTNKTDGFFWLPNSAFEVEPSTQYTFSVCCDGVISNSHGNGGHSPSELPFTTWFYISIDGTTKDWQHGGYDRTRIFTSSYSTFRQEGNRYIWTYTTAADEKYISIRLNGYSDGSTTIQIKFWNFKVEKGSKPTPWIPNPNDALYSAMGLDNGICYDTSGYGHNGTITGTLTYNSDSPRYSVATYFNGSSYAKTLLGELSWTNFDTLTISTWMKPTTTPSTFSGGFGIGHDNNNANYKAFSISNHSGKFTVDYANTSWAAVTSSYTMPLNVWHHYAVTLDGTTVKMYVDGALIHTGTIDWKTAALYPNPQIQIAVDLPGTDEKFTGYYSDARIYATALSAEDIKQLYEVSASIDNTGNVYGYEFSEV